MQKRIITSRDNPLLKRLKSLMRSHTKRKFDTFLIEGPKFILDAIEQDIEIITLVANESFQGKIPPVKSGTDVVHISDSLFKGLSGTSTSQGLIAEAKIIWRKISDIVQSGRPIAVAWRIQDPGNIGTIIRSCAAFGISGLVVGPECSNPFTSKAVRASTGAVLKLPLVPEGNLDKLVDALRSAGYLTFWTGTDGEIRPWDVEKKNSTAFFIGSEGQGFKEEEKKTIGRGIKIPIMGKMDSLNAGVAASIIAYELTKR